MWHAVTLSPLWICSSSLESFTRTAKGFISIDAFNLAAVKFFKPSLRLSKPQFFCTGFDLVVEIGNQTLRKLHALP